MLLPHFESFGILESALKSLAAQGVENRPKFSLGLAHYDLFGSNLFPLVRKMKIELENFDSTIRDDWIIYFFHFHFYFFFPHKILDSNTF